MHCCSLRRSCSCSCVPIPSTKWPTLLSRNRGRGPLSKVVLHWHTATTATAITYYVCVYMLISINQSVSQSVSQSLSSIPSRPSHWSLGGKAGKQQQQCGYAGAAHSAARMSESSCPISDEWRSWWWCNLSLSLSLSLAHELTVCVFHKENEGFSLSLSLCSPGATSEVFILFFLPLSLIWNARLYLSSNDE